MDRGDGGRLQVIFVSGCEGDTQRFRCHHAAEQLRMLGHVAGVYWQSDVEALDAAAEADVVVLHRPQQTHFLAAILEVASGRPLIYETDDLIFDPALVNQIPIVRQSHGMEEQRWHNYVLSTARVLKRCQAALTSTTPLAARLVAAGHPAWIHRNALSDEMLALSEQARSHRRSRSSQVLGYFSGTRSHDRDLELIAPALARLLGRHRTVRLLLGGYVTLPAVLAAYTSQIEHRPYVAWRDLPVVMAEADILLAPLDLSDPFTICRSELKYLEAAALATPMVASPAPAFVEAIRNSETGFLASDCDEWTERLERLLDDQELRAAVGTAAFDQVRANYSFEAQAPALERSLREVLATFAGRRVEPLPDLARIKAQWQADLHLQGQSIYMLTGCELGRAGTYRCRHRQEQLDLHDLRSQVVTQTAGKPWLSDAITYHLAILHRVADDAVVSAYIKLMHGMGRPVIFDTDDLVFRPELVGFVDAIKDWSELDKTLYRDGVQRYQRTLLACDAAIVSTEPLAQMVRELGQRAFVVRNSLGWEQIDRAAPLAEARLNSPLAGPYDPVVVGYFSGTATHDRDFLAAAPALLRLLSEVPQVRLRIVGPLALDGSFSAFADRIEHRPLVPLQELAAELASVDVALAPLEIDNPYCQAKSEVKYMEAGIVGVPIIATPVEAFRFAISHGTNGYLAATSAGWLDALRSLVADPAKRQAMGAAARADVLERYTPSARSRELLTVLAALWDELEDVRNTASFNTVFLDSLRLFEKLAHDQQQTIDYLHQSNAASQRTVATLQETATAQMRAIASLESDVEVSRHEVATLQHLLDKIARGRVMRILNAVSGRRRH